MSGLTSPERAFGDVPEDGGRTLHESLTGAPAATLVYALPLALLLLAWFRVRRREELRCLEALERSRDAGLLEPVSLHPVIDRAVCMGCGACTRACPQGDVLGVVGGQAELVNPTHCIGHGACQRACPTDAIALAIGTETRGVEIPRLGPDFETNVPGVFVAGELGGMGLIRNAVQQGRRAVEAIRKLPGVGEGDRLDLVVVGAGPAGIAASLTALAHGLRFATLEQDTLGGAIRHHPRGKVVVLHPVEFPLVGRVRMREMPKEALLAFFERVCRDTGLRIREGERVEEVRPEGDGFAVRSSSGWLAARAVLLAVGRRGTPRRLGVPGEERSKVVYRLADPAQYRGARVLVVGGGNSALEAAIRLAEERGCRPTLAYRGRAFVRATPGNRERVAALSAAGRLDLRLETVVEEIAEDRVRLHTRSGSEWLGNDAVVVCAGGVLPTDFLRRIGVEVETRFGEPLLP